MVKGDTVVRRTGYCLLVGNVLYLITCSTFFCRKKMHVIVLFWNSKLSVCAYFDMGRYLSDPMKNPQYRLARSFPVTLFILQLDFIDFSRRKFVHVALFKFHIIIAFSDNYVNSGSAPVSYTDSVQYIFALSFSYYFWGKWKCRPAWSWNFISLKKRVRKEE